MPYQYPYTSNSFLNLDYFIDQLAQVKQAVEPLRVSLNPTMQPNQFMMSVTMKTIYDAYLAGRTVVLELPRSSTMTGYINTFGIAYDEGQDKYGITGSGISAAISGGAIISAGLLILSTDAEDADSYGIAYIDQVNLI